MSRIGERRKKILDYVSGHPSSTLEFRTDYNSPVVVLDMVENVDDLVMQIITTARSCASFTQSGIRETSSGRSRSSLDIWRHAKSVLPDIDIFTIMESIYRLRNKLNMNYCGFVHRSVFKPRYYDWDYGNFLTREYRIMFSTWRKLHE